MSELFIDGALAPNLNREPKKYFLYRILDEIQKAALKIADWKELLSESEPEMFGSFRAQQGVPTAAHRS